MGSEERDLRNMDMGTVMGMDMGTVIQKMLEMNCGGNGSSRGIGEPV